MFNKLSKNENKHEIKIVHIHCYVCSTNFLNSEKQKLIITFLLYIQRNLNKSSLKGERRRTLSNDCEDLKKLITFCTSLFLSHNNE